MFLYLGCILWDVMSIQEGINNYDANVDGSEWRAAAKEAGEEWGDGVQGAAGDWASNIDGEEYEDGLEALDGIDSVPAGLGDYYETQANAKRSNYSGSGTSENATKYQNGCDDEEAENDYDANTTGDKWASGFKDTDNWSVGGQEE